MTVIARIENDGTLKIRGALTELGSVLFEDDFSGAIKKDIWAFETWGASPSTMETKPSDNGKGWGVYHVSGGHGSGALIAPMPNKTSGIVVVEFDWQPYSSTGSYRGSFFRIRGKNFTRNSLYGRVNQSDSNDFLELSAYAQSNVTVTTGAYTSLSPLVDEYAHYKIACDVDKSLISIYVNGVLEYTFAEAYLQDMDLEFSYGGYSGTHGTNFDNVSIKWEPGMKEPIASFKANGDLEVKKTISGEPIGFNILGMKITNVIENAF